MIKKAVFISRIGHAHHVADGHSRLYFGNEFCQRLLPGETEWRQAEELAKQKQIPLTLVTPFVTDEGLPRVERLLAAATKTMKAPVEVVVNDWGVLRLVTAGQWKGAVKPVLGRLLTKQKRDPRIKGLHIPPAAQEYFESFNADTAALREFLREKGVDRIELDNVPQGIRRADGGLRASLYVPYVYVTTTRLCMLSGSEQNPGPVRRIKPCGRECRDYTVTLTEQRMPVPLLVKGNTQFYRNDLLPDRPEDLLIDRIVEQPEIPL